MRTKALTVTSAVVELTVGMMLMVAPFLTVELMLGERLGSQIRAEFFDLFNHANLGQPGNVVGAPDFGRITRTRFSTGESGSSRQIQLAVKLVFN